MKVTLSLLQLGSLTVHTAHITSVFLTWAGRDPAVILASCGGGLLFLVMLKGIIHSLTAPWEAERYELVDVDLPPEEDHDEQYSPNLDVIFDDDSTIMHCPTRCAA